MRCPHSNCRVSHEWTHHNYETLWTPTMQPGVPSPRILSVASWKICRWGCDYFSITSSATAQSHSTSWVKCHTFCVFEFDVQVFIHVNINLVVKRLLEDILNSNNHLLSIHPSVHPSIHQFIHPSGKWAPAPEGSVDLVVQLDAPGSPHLLTTARTLPSSTFSLHPAVVKS